nr:hypothetical protein [Bacteroidales bacterium]
KAGIAELSNAAGGLVKDPFASKAVSGFTSNLLSTVYDSAAHGTSLGDAYANNFNWNSMVMNHKDVGNMVGSMVYKEVQNAGKSPADKAREAAQADNAKEGFWGGLWTSLRNGFTKDGGGIIEAIKEGAKYTGDYTMASMNDMVNSVASLPSKIANLPTAAANTLASVANTITNLPNTIVNLPTILSDTVSKYGSAIASVFGGMANQVGKGVERVGNLAGGRGFRTDDDLSNREKLIKMFGTDRVYADSSRRMPDGSFMPVNIEQVLRENNFNSSRVSMTKERQYDGSYLVTEYDKNGQISSQYAEPVNSNGFVGSGATEAGIGNAGKYAITPTDIENYKSMGINVSKDFSTGSGYGSNEEGYGFKNPVTYEEAMIMKKYLDRGKIGPSLDEIRSDVGSSKPTKSAIDAIGDAIGNAFDQVEDAWEKTTKTKLNADPGASVFGQTFNQRSKEYYDSVMKNNAARSQYEQIPESNLPSDDGRSWTDRDVNSADRMKQTKQASGWNEAKGEFNKVAADVLGRYPSDLYGNDIASKANL